MLRRSLLFVVLAAMVMWTAQCGKTSVDNQKQAEFGLVIHGGAGTILKQNMTPEIEADYRAKLTEALDAGYRVLEENGSALDAVQAAIIVMENSPLFNAGKGAVFSADGRNEMDASIMDGKTYNCGAVAAVSGIKNPILLARKVMDESKHVMMATDGAEAFAATHGFEQMPDEYFHTDRRWEQLQKAKAKEGDQTFLDHSTDEQLGTVGAVALDKDGNLAAATSTGGMTNKKFGRVGDSPIIGAGTYANNATCAVSGTGHGEYFIRGVVAFDVSANMEYGGKSLAEAADTVVTHKLTDLGGTGGVIAIDHLGNVAMPFNTPGMYRGYRLEGGETIVKIYKDE